MRLFVFVVCAVCTAISVVSLSTLSAGAQPADQYGSSESTETSQNMPEKPALDARTSEASDPPPETKAVDQEAAATEEGLEKRVVNTVAEDPYSQVIDDSTRGRFSAPGWQRGKTARSYNGTAALASEKTSQDARFKVRVPDGGYYTLYARWPDGAKNASSARFGVSTPNGMRWEEVDQTLDGGSWVRIGSFEMSRADAYSVRVSSEVGAVADAVMISKNVLVGANAQMVSVGDPDELSSEEAAATSRSASTMEVSGRGAGGNAIVRTARRHLGNPYDYNYGRCKQGASREDCSCLTRNVFLKHGRKLPDSPIDQYRLGSKISKSQIRMGDLVFHDLTRDGDLKDEYKDHVSISSGDGNIIHASSYFGKVVESRERYLKDYWGAKRIKPR